LRTTCLIITLWTVAVFSVRAGDILIGGIVTRVANTNGNSDSFQVLTTGDTGPCAGNNWIVFPRSSAASDGVHNRAYSTAITAMMSGKKILIHNYQNDACTGAVYIEIR